MAEVDCRALDRAPLDFMRRPNRFTLSLSSGSASGSGSLQEGTRMCERVNRAIVHNRHCVLRKLKKMCVDWAGRKGRSGAPETWRINWIHWWVMAWAQSAHRAWLSRENLRSRKVRPWIEQDLRLAENEWGNPQKNNSRFSGQSEKCKTLLCSGGLRTRVLGSGRSRILLG